MIELAPDTPQPLVAKKRFAVTGGGGYIGSVLSKRIIDQGHELTVLGRSRPANIAPELYQFISYDLTKPLPSGALAGVDTLVHLAHDMDDTEGLKINQTATMALRDAAREIDGLRFFYMSSQSARADAPTSYGRIKWQIERLCDGPNEVIVRPGFVYGGAAKGAFGLLVQMLERTPIMPVIGMNTQIQPVHVDDLCEALMRVAGENKPERSYNIAMAETVSFRRFLKLLAQHRLRRRILTLPVPLWIALSGAFICLMVPGIPTVPRERILGLTGIIPMDTAASLSQLNLELRRLNEGFQVQSTPPYRLLIMEAKTVLGYIMGARPSLLLVRRYVRAVRALGDLEPLNMPRFANSFPSLLKFREPLPSSDSRLSQRLHLAVSIVEMSPEGADVFAAYEPVSKIRTLVQLLLPLALEAVLLPLRMLRR